MPGIRRREFFVAAGGAFGALTGLSIPRRAAASSSPRAVNPDAYGVLTDLSQCIGCRKCEWACNAANNLPQQSLESFEDKSVFAIARRPDANRFTVVNESPASNGGKPTWVKVQCMHCQDPACASACIVSAFKKEEIGAVTYNAWRCMGCRYCMVACPFQIPAYEYDNAFAPTVRKCTLCFDRISSEGKAPACVEICPPQCLTFGKRSDLLALAHEKIARHPDKYVDHVYGEREVGGTSWLYVSHRPFEELGLPRLPEAAPPRLTESIQHGVFKNFFPPAALFTVLGTASWLFRPREENGGVAAGGAAHAAVSGGALPAARDAAREAPREAAHEAVHEHAAPVATPFWTRGTLSLLALAVVGAIFAAVRLVLGLATVTNLTDQYPWGIWIAIDVATGVALAAGGFTTAAIAHIFHRGSYHAIVRPALLSALLGYTFVVLGLLFDLGKYYNVWHPMLPPMWSGNSVLFEVGMCVMTYLTVLYLEFVPIVTERWMGRVRLPGALSRLDRAAETALRLADRFANRVMGVLIIAGVVLSCLHQSSLGSLMLIAPSKMHPLWFTPILPLLFLLSAISVGYPVVMLESFLSARAFHREPEMPVLSRLGRILPVILAIYLAFKIGDLLIRGAAGALLAFDFPAFMFIAEITIGTLVPIAILVSERRRNSPRALLLAALCVIAGVVLNRVNVFLVAYTPLYATKVYFPSIGEISVTVGLFAALMLAYRWVVSTFPVLAAESDHAQ